MVRVEVPAVAEETATAPVAEETATETTPAPAPDELRQPMLDLLTSELGEDLVGFELTPGDDLCVRVNRSV